MHPENPESSIRALFVVLATGCSISGVGIGMLLTGWHPKIGIALMVAGYFYLLYELLTWKLLVERVPEPMLRFLAGMMISVFTLLIVGPDLKAKLNSYYGQSPTLPASRGDNMQQNEAESQSLKTPNPSSQPKVNVLPPTRSTAPAREVVEHPYDLTGKRREKFKTLLEPAPDEIDTLRIGCLAGSDSACVAAGDFLILLSEAGWKIDSDKVFSMQAQIPVSGIAIAALPQQPRPSNLPPHLGIWQVGDKSETKLAQVFTQMSVPVHPVGGPDLPAGTLGVYFGPDPGPQMVRLYTQ